LLTAASLILKVIEFILTKIAGKAIEWRMDEKKRAAEAFLGLFDAVTGLRSTIDEFVRHLNPIVRGERGLWMPRDWTVEFSERVDQRSKEFIEAVNRVRKVIEVYDLDLYLLLSNMRQGKESLVRLARTAPSSPFSILQKAFYVEFKGFKRSDFAGVHYSIPPDIDEQELEAVYAGAGNGKWQTGLLSDLIKLGIDQTVRKGDTTEALVLHKVLLRQSQLFSDTSDALRKFIKNNFKIEDLLAG
jgi:hypothetical protein